MALSLKSSKCSYIKVKEVMLWVWPTKSERGRTIDKNKTAHRTMASIWRLGAKLNQRWQPQAVLWVWPTCLSTEWKPRCWEHPAHLSTETKEIHSHTEGPGDISAGTPPVIFRYICVDNLQALTNSGPIYRRISRRERHKTELLILFFFPGVNVSIWRDYCH